MRIMTVWACECGKRYKILSEADRFPEDRTELACPRCESVAAVVGTPLMPFTEISELEYLTGVSSAGA